MFGATDGDFGTVRMQNQLLMLLAIIGMEVDASKRVMIPRAQDKINEEGVLVDEKTIERINKLIENLKN